MAEAIDVHAHFAPAHRFDEMAAVDARVVPDIVIGEPHPTLGDMVFFSYPSGTINGPVPVAVVDVEARLADMALTAVTHQVLSARPQMFTYDLPGPTAAALAGIANEGLVETAGAHPDEFSVLIALPMQDPDAAVAEVEKWADNRLVRGAMVDSNIDGRDFAEPAFAPIWAALEAADLAVLVHPYQGDVVGKERLSRHYLFNLIGNPVDTTIALANVLFGGLIDRYPNLRWGFVHGGGVSPYLVGRWDHGWHQRDVTRELIPHQMPSELMARFWFDCIVHDHRTLGYLAEIVGWDKVMVGSDCPFDMGYRDPVAFVDGAGLTPAVRDAVLSVNANAFLRRGEVASPRRRHRRCDAVRSRGGRVRLRRTGRDRRRRRDRSRQLQHAALRAQRPR